MEERKPIQKKNMTKVMEQEKRRRHIRKVIRVCMAWVLAIVIVAALLALGVILLRAVGGRSLRDKVDHNAPVISMDDGEIQEVENQTGTVWKEGWVRHNGKIYEYNENILNFLVLGIDEMGTVKEATTGMDGGQSDAIFLVIANPDNKSIKLLAINRDTMTQIRRYGMGEAGEDLWMYAQIAVQHGFGDGKELSCELSRDAVSALLYDMPIHGYAAINMGAIPQLNDALGGVDVTVLSDDLLFLNKKWTQGTELHLEGMDAYWYVKGRDIKRAESNLGRLARQKQYLSTFIQKAISEVKRDITLPVTLYQELNKYMVTDISLDEVTYLAGELLSYHFDSNDIYTLEGTTVMGEAHEEFYPDKDAMKELVIQLFYREVEQE